ncbi:MAG TPA: vWA domain-containing protein [Myxococcaceae bacterium]|nr:vWA domain-containing protein [Myxococcaceae bacterium]
MNRQADATDAVNGLLARVVALEQRLAGLNRGAPTRAALWTRVADLAAGAPSATLPPRPVLSQLTQGLSRLGLHTTADAQLLRRGLEDARAKVLAARLVERCERAVGEAARAVRQVERAVRMGTPVPARRALVSEVAALARVIRLVLILRAPAGPMTPEEDGGSDASPSPHCGGAPEVVVNTPHLVIAAALEARSRTGRPAPQAQRLDLEVAHALLLDVDLGEEERAAGLQLRWRVVQAKDALWRLGDAEDLPGLLREVRRLARRDPGRAYQRLWGLHRKARLDGRDALADAAGRALAVLAGSPERWSPDASRVAEAFAMNEDPEAPPSAPVPGADALSVALFGQSFGRDPEQTRLLELARGASRFVEVEQAGGGWEGRVLEDAADAATRSEWPSRRLDIEHTGAPSRAADFIIGDPRRILLDLAAGRQAVRVFVEHPPAPKPARPSNVRIYVCDGSASMRGARARFRDALILAELEALLLREHRGRAVDPFYYCYFNDQPGPLQRVENGREVLRHVDRLLAATPASGRTDTSRALLAAFDAIAQARGRDPGLSRASVVLVTDGEDDIDPTLILRAHEPLRSLPISLSFVSLGHENPALRTLARSLRRQRQHAFYVHLSDTDLRWAKDAFSAPVRSLAPEDWSPESVDVDALEPYLVALEQVAGGEPVATPPVSSAAFEARFPPEQPEPVASTIPPVSPSRVLGILEALTATVALLPLERRAAECVWLLDHLLATYGETLPGWQGGLRNAGAEAAAALDRLRLLARRPAGGGRGRGKMAPPEGGEAGGAVEVST